jgi:OOP family OmpA-OmpF porin
LVSKGIEANRIYTEGKGKRNPVKTDCAQKNRKALIACLAPNRRVEVEVVGTSQQPQQ